MDLRRPLPPQPELNRGGQVDLPRLRDKHVRPRLSLPEEFRLVDDALRYDARPRAAVVVFATVTALTTVTAFPAFPAIVVFRTRSTTTA